MAIGFSITLTGDSDFWFSGRIAPMKQLSESIVRILKDNGIRIDFPTRAETERPGYDDNDWLRQRTPEENVTDTGERGDYKSTFVLYDGNKQVVQVSSQTQGKTIKTALNKYFKTFEEQAYRGGGSVRVSANLVDTSRRMRQIVDEDLEEMEGEDLLKALAELKGTSTEEQLEKIRKSGQLAQLEISAAEIERDIEREQTRAEASRQHLREKIDDPEGRRSIVDGELLAKRGRPTREVITQEEWDQEMEKIAYEQSDEELRDFEMDEFARRHAVGVTAKEWHTDLVSLIEYTKEEDPEFYETEEGKIRLAEIEAEYKRTHRIQRERRPTRMYPGRADKPRPWEDYEEGGVNLWHEKVLYGKDPDTGELIFESMADIAADPDHSFTDEELRIWKDIYSKWRRKTPQGRESTNKYNASELHKASERRYRTKKQSLTNPTIIFEKREFYTDVDVRGDTITSSTYDARGAYEKSEKGRAARANYNAREKLKTEIQDKVKAEAIKLTGEVPTENWIRRTAAPLIWDAGLVRNNLKNKAWQIYDVEQGDESVILEGGIVETPKDRYIKFANLEYAEGRIIDDE